MTNAKAKATVTFAELRERFDADRALERSGERGIIENKLASALDAIGWRSAGGESSVDVAAAARHVIASCVAGHHDPRRAAREIAELLRMSAAGLDGSSASASAYVPAGEALLRRYAGPG